jgi:hypothetical protein
VTLPARNFFRLGRVATQAGGHFCRGQSSPQWCWCAWIEENLVVVQFGFETSKMRLHLAQIGAMLLHA